MRLGTESDFGWWQVGRRTSNTRTQDRPRAAVALITMIYFFSGICSLIDEVVWVRLLKLTLGNTVYASSVVVSTFMGGLALGALVMGRYADRIKRRLRAYAALEMCITLSALLMPVGLTLTGGLYRWYFVRFDASPAGLMFLQVFISGVLLLVPTMLMGSTLPLLGRYVTGLEERVGHLVGRLYALNTLGAATGCFLAGFVFIRVAGVMGSLYIAACLNVAVALGGWWLSRCWDASGRAKVTQAPRPGPAEAMRVSVPGRQATLIAACFLSGFISIGYELLWMRSIVVPLGGFTYVFSAVLTVYLFGNVIGAWIGSRLSRRLACPGAVFGVTLALLGALGILYIPWFRAWFAFLDRLPALKSAFEATLGAAGIRKASLPIFHGTALFLVPSIAMGIGFPLAMQAWGKLHQKVGRTTATVYAVNTIGAVLGGLITGFLLIPGLGVQGSMLLLSLGGIWLGGLMITRFYPTSARIASVGAVLATLALSMAALGVPANLFKQTLGEVYGGNILEIREGVTTTVAVTKKKSRHLAMVIDNIEMAGDGVRRSAQKTLGHLPVLLHGDPKDVLSFGFGTGETSYCLARHDLRRIDCVEISPEVTDMALKHFAHINLGEDLARKVNMIYMDGKNFLGMTGRRYDIIINDSNVHSTSGSAPLFTKEHFQNALAHLRNGGLFVTKLHLEGYPKSHFESILGTFSQVFPHLTVWFPVTRPFVFFYLVGSREPQLFSPEKIDKELAKERVRKSVQYLRYGESADVLSCYVCDKADIGRYLSRYTANSDYRPFIEFSLHADRMVIEHYLSELLRTVRRGSITDHINWGGLSTQQRTNWQRGFMLRYEVAGLILQAHANQTFLSRLIAGYRGLKLMPGHPTLISMRDRSLSEIEIALYAGIVSPVAVAKDMDNLLLGRPDMGSAWLVKSMALRKSSDLEGAFLAGGKAVENSPDNPKAHINMGVILAQKGRSEDAADCLSKALELNSHDAQAHYTMAKILAEQGKIEQTLVHYDEAVKLRPEIDIAPGLHQLLAANYARAGQFTKALTCAKKALELARSTRNTDQIRRIEQSLEEYAKYADRPAGSRHGRPPRPRL
ncbi:MAG: fused MFS/spermidine synthase [Phycisphaerales bacterium]|nr:MAG: fused MFS/spermidine synthase [Phycisphaerales bacterium]